MGVGKFRRDQPAGFLFVGRVHERKQVANRDRMDTRGLEIARRAPHRLAVERNEDLAQIIAALGNLMGAALRRDRRRFVVKIIE